MDNLDNLFPETCGNTSKKNMSVDLEYAQAVAETLEEWDSENDEEAYRDL